MVSLTISKDKDGGGAPDEISSQRSKLPFWDDPRLQTQTHKTAVENRVTSPPDYECPLWIHSFARWGIDSPHRKIADPAH